MDKQSVVHPFKRVVLSLQKESSDMCYNVENDLIIILYYIILYYISEINMSQKTGFHLTEVSKAVTFVPWKVSETEI